MKGLIICACYVGALVCLATMFDAQSHTFVGEPVAGALTGIFLSAIIIMTCIDTTPAQRPPQRRKKR